MADRLAGLLSNGNFTEQRQGPGRWRCDTPRLVYITSIMGDQWDESKQVRELVIVDHAIATRRAKARPAGQQARRVCQGLTPPVRPVPRVGGRRGVPPACQVSKPAMADCRVNASTRCAADSTSSRLTQPPAARPCLGRGATRPAGGPQPHPPSPAPGLPPAAASHQPRQRPRPPAPPAMDAPARHAG
jgi:hypothetical protein